MARSSAAQNDARLSNVTTRLDRLPWGRFHLSIMVALGIVWLLDAFEVNIIGSVLPAIQKIFNITSLEASLTVTIWLVGIMFGAFFFGYLADRFGRRKLFILTLSLYATCTIISALSFTYPMFLTFRFLTAIGVGAEYSAVNTAISEFIPPRVRGRTNAAVMSFWNIGALLSAIIALVFINLLSPNVGWRVAFAFGAICAVMIVWLRRSVPESPRWLLSHRRVDEAEKVVGEIEEWVACEKHLSVDDLPAPAPAPLSDSQAQPFFSQLKELFTRYPGRLALGCALDLSEAFGYYGIFAFMSLTVLPAIHIADQQIPLFYIAGDIGAVFGGFIVIALLDKLGRKVSVPAFYTLAAISAVLVGPAAATGSGLVVLIAFIAANFFGTSAWVSAYPTFTEIFPTHLRGTGVGFSIAVGRIGAGVSPILLVWIATQTALGIPGGFAIMGLLWLVGAIAMVPWYYRGVEGANRSLEQMVPAPSGVESPAIAE